MAVVLQSNQDYRNANIGGYEFAGYELSGQGFNVSALTNCGGFDETFLPAELNDKEFIDDFTKTYDILKRFLINNPQEHHANTNVIAILAA